MFTLHSEVSGAGADVVLLHGLGATNYSWHKTTQALETDFRCHAVDLPGFGRSWEPPATYASTMAEQADMIIAYMTEHAMTDVRLIGHSMGGGVCLHIAEKLASAGHSTHIKGMALVAPALVPNAMSGFLGLALMLTAFLPGEDVARSLLKRIYHDSNAVPDLDAYAAEYAINFSPSRTPSMSTHAANMASKTHFALNFDAYDLPVKLIWGAEDQVVFTRYGGKSISDLLGADAMTIPDCGHAPHEEFPGKVNAELSSFLKTL